MITEAWSWITTDCLPIARKMGYLSEAIAIRERFRRNHEAWEEHLRASQQCILDAVGLTGMRREVLVLGSGLLLDVPLQTLSDRFDKVRLVDIVHLKEAETTASEYDNVELVSHDVTDLAEKFLSLVKARKFDEALALTAQPTDWIGGDVDLVISINLLSQLPLPFISLLENKAPELLSSDDVIEFCDRIQRQHLEWLRAFQAPVCVISDIEWRREDMDTGQVSVRRALPETIQLPAPHAQWTWNIAPPPEVEPTIDVQHAVACWIR
ncbi:MAG: hypothetical protein Alpg2KO_21390 [Alphaproteobacteria bacterium]